ncbi:hypothetical protein K6H11_002901 [Candida tropicalis]
MLERFSCAMNHIGRREQIFDFPTCLQSLDLHCNELNGNTPFSGLNLLKCHYLRKLDLSNANIRGGYHLDQLPTVVELYSFPKSLTSLSIRGCNATSIVGTLPYFPQLEEVDLRDNEAVVEMFGEAVTEEYWLPDCCFPDTIKRIWITKNHFDSREFENLEKSLQLIPCFESLVATDQNINFGNSAQKLLNLSKDSEINMRGIEYWRTVTLALSVLYETVIIDVDETETLISNKYNAKPISGYFHTGNNRPWTISYNQFLQMNNDSRVSFVKHIIIKDPEALFHLREKFPSAP